MCLHDRLHRPCLLVPLFRECPHKTSIAGVTSSSCLWLSCSSCPFRPPRGATQERDLPFSPFFSPPPQQLRCRLQQWHCKIHLLCPPFRCRRFRRRPIIVLSLYALPLSLLLSLPPLRRRQPADRSHSQVVRDFSTIEEIIEYIVNTRQHPSALDGQPILGFHWRASEVDELSEQLDARLVELDEAKIHRFEYDYKSETVYLNMMGESTLHYQVQRGLRDYIRSCIAKSLATANDARIRDLLRSIRELGTADIKYESKICKQPDGSFGQADTLPSLVYEVS